MCTAIRFIGKNGEMYFGRNLDWAEDYGEKVVVTPRGYKYQAEFLGEIQPRYGVIGMAVVVAEKPLYFDCANEAGLMVAGLNFPGYAEYEPDVVAGKKNVAAYEFPLWVAMNFQTVDEAAEALREVAIVSKALNADYPVSYLHWMISDAKRCIVVEYTKRGMEIFENEFGVLANQPGFSWHLENLRNYMNVASPQVPAVRWAGESILPFGTGSLMRGLPGDYYSPSRFVRATYFNTHYPMQSSENENIARLFHTLSSVAMIDGAAAMADGRFEKTIYASGYSAASGAYYWQKYDDLAVQSKRFAEVDLDGAKLQ